jgi:hypothetical protein
MPNRRTGSARARALVLLIVVLPFLAASRPQDVTVEASPTAGRPLDLAESLVVTFAVTGPAPLRVELPESLLAPETNRDWEIRPAGPASVTPLGGGRERWARDFRLEPWVPGGKMTVRFAPLRVNGREIPGPACEVVVKSPGLDARPEASMGVTPPESLPPPARPEPTSVVWWLLPGLIAAVLLLALWRVRRTPKPVPPPEWAATAFDRLEREAASGAALVEGVAAVVRGYVERRFGIPATKLTTEELLAAADRAGWPAEQTDPLRRLLEECDRAKFAGDVPDDDGCRRLLARGREWVDLTTRPPDGPSPTAGPLG